jgi:hypothetical protein
MRTALIPVAAILALTGPALAPDSKVPAVLRSSIISPPLQLPDSKLPVYGIGIDVELNAKGDAGHGSITLQLSPPSYDEYGDPVTGTEVDQVERKIHPHVPPVTLECRFSLEKVGFIGRVNTPGVTRSLYRVEGPKLRSKLYYATTGPGLTDGRLLVHGRDDRVEFVVELAHLKPVKDDGGERPLIPCHPGCFPAGTLVRVADGARRIELLRAGDIIMTIGPDGREGRAAVQTVFTSTNRLIDVRTDRGVAVTTEAQPLCLAAGGFSKAGDLKPGDRVWRWRDGRRTEAVVREVAPTGRTETVYNLIIGDSAVFVAGDFLARGKPPAVVPPPAAAAAAAKPHAHGGPAER